MIVRSPRAPVLRFAAPRAAAWSASGVICISTLSSARNFWYCLTIAFFGSVRMRMRSPSSSAWRGTTTGSRPTNSGMSPYFSRSSGMTCSRIAEVSLVLSRSVAPKPIVFLPTRASTIFSRPSNAPPQTNRMFVVSI